MKNSTRSQDEYSKHAMICRRSYPNDGYVTDTSSACQIIRWEEFHTPDPQAPAKHSAINDLVREWEQDERFRAELEQARLWVADNFYRQDGDTLRTLRLRKGLSQIDLAEILETSQSHVARMESGTYKLLIDTGRKLCDVLEIDMNTLNEALRRQENLTSNTKTKKLK